LTEADNWLPLSFIRSHLSISHLVCTGTTKSIRNRASSMPSLRQDNDQTLPTGTVTFLFTDIERSSRLWDQHPEAMRDAMAAHDAMLRAAVIENDGWVVKMRGDGLHAVFASAAKAVAAALAGQRALRSATWHEGIGQLRIRMGLHTGSAQLRDGDYFGPAVNRAARLQEAGHGGQVLISRATASLARDQLQDGIDLLDLGPHQLKDVPRPERIFQLVAPNLQDRFPPLRAQSAIRHNLPVLTTSFIGRKRELDRAKSLLSQGRLLTLIGPGGTGKTRLTLKLAHENRHEYAEGVWLVELAPLTDQSMIVPAILKLFSLREQPGRSILSVVVDFLRGKEMLLIMDNCEHLIERCAVLAETFLDAAPSLSILASSRESLGVPGELILRVPSLSLPDDRQVTVASLEQSEASHLLIERARSVRPEFQLTEENAGAVAEICQRLDGIPLAIELAAARLRMFSPHQIATRLSDRFRLLTGGSRTAVPRQQTLQALIDWSYDLLDDNEKMLFRRLSVSAGGWTFDFAEEIGAGLDVMESLDQLVNKSMVQVEEDGPAVRFSFLETIRQYARDQLFAAGDGEEMRDRHFAYFARLASEAELGMGGERTTELVALLGPETDNIRLAIEWGLDRDILATVDLLVGSMSFWVQHTPPSFVEISQWVESASQRLDDMAPHAKDDPVWLRAWARARMVAGQVALTAGEFEKVRTHMSEAIDIARSLDEKRTLITALGYLAIREAAMRGTPGADDDEAYQAAKECLALAREMGLSFYESSALSMLGGMELARGNSALGEKLLREAGQGSQFTGAVAQFQSAMMMVYVVGDPVRALSILREARRQFRQLDHAHFLALSNSEIAHIQRRSGEFSAAKSLYRETITHFQWFGSRAAIANQLECFAFIARAEEKWERAARLLGAAEALRELIGTEMLPREREEYEQEIAALKEQMDGTAFDLVWSQGRALSMDQAVEYALHD
jgi:predicted ATPase/class 3 adenylate cyclase